MIQAMIQNMLGDYAKFVQPLGNGQVRINVPEDLNDPSKGSSLTVDITMEEALKLMSLFQQEKKYQSGDKVIKEGDSDFDINKWAKLAINEVGIKNKIM